MDKFDLFPRLPIEIRSRIWSFALSGEVYQLSRKPTVVEVYWQDSVPRQLRVLPPRLVLTCREAWGEWAQILRVDYPLFCEYVASSSCNPSADLIIITSLHWNRRSLPSNSSLQVGFCSNGCRGRRLLSRLCLRLVTTTPADITDSQCLNCHVLTNAGGVPVAKERTWDTALPLKRLPVNELGLQRLRDVWFEGQDLFGTHSMNGDPLFFAPDEAFFGDHGPMHSIFASYCFRYSVDTGKVEAALLPRRDALRYAAGERWGHSGILESLMRFGFTASRITIRREGYEVDADDGINGKLWQQIRPRIAGESRAMIWHRVIWNSLVGMFEAFLLGPHRAPSGPSPPSQL